MNMLFSLCASEDWEMEQFDICTAFLNGKNKMPVYTTQVQGFYNPRFPKKVWLLKQSIYGTKQAHREFNADLEEKLRSIGFTPYKDDNSLFTFRRNDEIIHIPMFVDDGLVFSNSKALIKETREKLEQLYKLVWTTNPTLHLGIKITRDRQNRTIHLSQEHYLKNVLDRFDMTHCNTTSTPFPTSIELSPGTNEEVEDAAHLPYQQAIGCLNWAAVHTRPDIQYAVSTLARYSSKYTYRHWQVVKHLLRYIQGTLDRGIIFKKHDAPSTELRAYADADYAACTTTRRSTTGYVFTLGGSLISWKSRRQPTVALSTTEAEYMALGDCAKHCLWFRRMISHLTQTPIPTSPISLPPLSIFNDNNGAVFLSQESATNSRSKHIDIRHHFIRDLILSHQISTHMIDTKLMPADFLTKNAPKEMLNRCRFLIGNVNTKEIHLISTNSLPKPAKVSSRGGC
jgi:hypothetical protein